MSNPHTPAPNPHLLHASCVNIAGKGVLLLGPSGSGKSDLALRLIDEGAALVGDDRIAIGRTGNTLLASPAPRLEGLLEVRGVGILTMEHIPAIPLALAIKLVPAEEVERMPVPRFFDCLGCKLPLLSLNPFENSITAKIRFALKYEVLE